MTIPEFIQRCDAFCEDANVSRVWLSKRLFNDTYHLGNLATGNADIGVKRMERAVEQIEAFRRKACVAPDRRQGEAAA